MGSGASAAASKVAGVIKEGLDEDASNGPYEQPSGKNIEFSEANFGNTGIENSLPDTSLISQENIRKLIKLEYQRRAFTTFLKQYYNELNAQEYLTHCINVEKFLVQPNKAKGRADLMGLIAHYEKRSNSKMAIDPKHPAVVIFRTMEPEDKELKDLTDDELQALMLKSQSDIIGMLSPLFAQFMYSPEYEAMLAETPEGVVKHTDRRFSSRYSSIHPDRKTTIVVDRNPS